MTYIQDLLSDICVWAAEYSPASVSQRKVEDL
jgi:hypothetical protein